MHNIYIYIYIYIYILKRIYTQIVLIMKNNLQIILRHQPWRASAKHTEVPTCGRPLGPLPLPTSSVCKCPHLTKLLLLCRRPLWTTPYVAWSTFNSVGEVEDLIQSIHRISKGVNSYSHI